MGQGWVQERPERLHIAYWRDQEVWGPTGDIMGSGEWLKDQFVCVCMHEAGASYGIG